METCFCLFQSRRRQRANAQPSHWESRGRKWGQSSCIISLRQNGNKQGLPYIAPHFNILLEEQWQLLFLCDRKLTQIHDTNLRKWEKCDTKTQMWQNTFNCTLVSVRQCRGALSHECKHTHTASLWIPFWSLCETVYFCQTAWVWRGGKKNSSSRPGPVQASLAEGSCFHLIVSGSLRGALTFTARAGRVKFRETVLWFHLKKGSDRPVQLYEQLCLYFRCQSVNETC